MFGPRVVSVNVGLPRTVEWDGRLVTSGIWKEPVSGPIRVAGVNLDGDDQADRRVHGGPDKAVYAYSVEDYAWWEPLLGALAPGTFGENLTTTGVDLNTACIGDRWRVGSALLEVAQPRKPCFKLGMRMNDASFPGTFERGRRPGAYFRIIEEGVVQQGDAIDVRTADPPAIEIRSLVDDEIDVDGLLFVLRDPRVPEGWRRAAARALERGMPRR